MCVCVARATDSREFVELARFLRKKKRKQIRFFPYSVFCAVFLFAIHKRVHERNVRTQIGAKKNRTHSLSLSGDMAIKIISNAHVKHGHRVPRAFVRIFSVLSVTENEV